jgi:hypothetical protein
MRKIIQYTFLILLFSFKISFCSIHSFGEIDKDFSYEDLAIDQGYFKGAILNKSPLYQKDIRIRFDAYDVFNKIIWDVTVRIDFIKSGGKFIFKKFISYQKLETPLQIQAINLNSKQKYQKKDQNKDVDINDYSYQSAKRLPIYFSGSGNKMSDLFELEKGLLKITFDHSGNRLCTVYLKDKNGKSLKMIINEIGKFHGSKGVNIPYAGNFFINVEADQNSNWSLSLDKPTEANIIDSQEDNISITKGKDGVIYLQQK